MKKLVVVALLFSSTASLAFAQGRFGQGRFGQARFGSTSGTASSTALPGIRNVGGNNRKSVQQTLGKLMMIAGTAKSVASGSLVLTNQRGDYTVNATSTTRVVNRVWKPIALGDIQAGDKVRVFGRVKNLTVAAIVVRDISLPPHATGTSSSTTSSTAH